MRAVLERDFLAEVSRPRFFWFRTGAALLVSLVMVAVVAGNGGAFRESPDQVARTLFLGGAWSLLGLLALLTPTSVVGSILDERQRETLALVLATPVRPIGFALAKLLARSASVFGWALAAAVPLTVTGLMGGVAGGEVADLMLLAAGVVLELAAWGLWVSSVTRRLATAAVLAYLLPLLRWGVVALLFFPLCERPRAMQGWAFSGEFLAGTWTVFATSPVPSCLRMGSKTDYDRAVAASLNQGQYAQVFWRRDSMGRWVPVPVAPPPAAAVPFAAARPTVVYFLFSLVAVLASLLAAGRRLSREAEPQAGLFDRWKGSRRWLRTLPGTGNPMVWKESRLLNTAASRPLYYALLGLLLAGELAFLVFATTDGMSGWDIVQTALAIAAAHACLLGLVAAVAGAASMAHERSTGTLDLLRVSLLTPAEVFRGKVAGAVRALGLLALFPVLHLLLCAATGFLHPLVAAAALVLLAATLLFWLGVGFACGALLFRSGRAVSLAAGIFGAALVGVPLLAVLLDEGAGMHDASEFLAGLWPPGTVYYFLEAAARAFPGDYSSWYWYGRVVRHTGATVVAASLLLAAPAALLVARRLLARRLHREGESG